VATPLPALPGVAHRLVPVGDVRLHVAEAGAAGAPAVLLLHGWPQHWWEWRGVMPGLAGAGHRVLAPDLRGFGWSDAPPGDYAKATLAADLLVLLDELGIARAGIVGHDWGGYLGFLLALRHPERVSGLLAINAAQPFPPRDLRTLAQAPRLAYQLALAAPLLGEGLVRGPGQLLPRAALRSARLAQADLEAFLAPLREPARARASVALYRTFLTRELPAGGLAAHGERLRAPTLVLHGAGDPVLRPALLRGAARRADALRVELVRDAGHFLVDERPALVLERARALFGA
jgi:pimeloyl-ACP methyl ester carboxylesterase